MQKLIASSTVLALALTALPVLAGGFFPMPSSDVLVVNSNSAVVGNTVTTKADTGDNEITVFGGENETSGDITTDTAVAQSVVGNDINYNDTKVSGLCGFGCSGDVKVINKNSAFVKNTVTTKADTGDNEIKVMFGGSNNGAISTGASSAGSSVTNIVNSNITRIRR